MSLALRKQILQFGPNPSGPAPVVTAITPDTGTTAGGTAITDLAGTGFVSGATVTIGGTPATSVVFVSSTELTCVTPAGTVGAQDVVVTNPDTQDSGTSGDGLFTYTPAFDLATLPLTLYQKTEDAVVTHPTGSSTSLSWDGTASAGTSGDGRNVFITGAPIVQLDDGPSLGAGQPTVMINAPVNNIVPYFTSNTHLTPLDGVDVVSITEAFMGILIYLIDITGGTGTFADQCIMGIYQPRLAMLVGGVANNKLEAEAAFATIVAAAPDMPTGRWTWAQLRFKSGTGLQIRFDKNTWQSIARGILTFFGEQWIIGAGGQGASANGYYSTHIAAQTAFDDATSDKIYDTIKATYPGAMLP